MILMDGDSGNGQWWCSWWQYSEVIPIGNGTAVAQWMAQWAADICQWMRGQRWEKCLVFGWLLSCEIRSLGGPIKKTIQVRMFMYIGNAYYYATKENCPKPQNSSILKNHTRPSTSKKSRKYFSYLGLRHFIFSCITVETNIFCLNPWDVALLCSLNLQRK